ncbi:MAG: beta-ketoacyl-[acyl-carrier-protein] synthase family protein [Nitrospiraceae bacterium]|jgi:3-oxoacyl-[acyl-carrier-protein] synthase-1|nr:beta-ketoacyl-[acyl-carrier-protein] synthase family protein [Nitrospiraceae bacterium]
MQPLILTHVSLVNSLGEGVDATLTALRERRSGLLPCSFRLSEMETWVGQVSGVESVRFPPNLADYDCRNNRLALLGIEQDGFFSAVKSAIARHGRNRIGLFLGTSTSGLDATELAYRHRDPESGALPLSYSYRKTQNTFSLAAFVKEVLDLDGPTAVVSSACASTAKVFAEASRMISAGLCDAAVVGGADSLCMTTLYGFNSLGLLSREPCRPFDAERDGISIGEGAGFALLEKDTSISDPKAVKLFGVGESSDAYHMSTPHPEGMGAYLAMQRALESAGLKASDMDYLHLHGTASKANDASEDKAVTALFGSKTPCSSTKGWTGHGLGVSGITNAIVAMLCIQHHFLPGSLQTRSVDPLLKSGYLIENGTACVDYVMSNSFGFGGSNCSLVFGRAT